MPTPRSTRTLQRLARIKQIQKMIVLGLNAEDMAERLGVSSKTIQHDIAWQYDKLTKEAGRQIATQREALLAELGRTYAEAVKDGERARQGIVEVKAKKDGEDNALDGAKPRLGSTDKYLTVRIKAMHLMAQLTGAAMPVKVKVDHGPAGLDGARRPDVSMVSEAELIEMHRITAEVLLEAPRFNTDLNGNN
jgi:hypothetical protein